jgi:hypothetical protein
LLYWGALVGALVTLAVVWAAARLKEWGPLWLLGWQCLCSVAWPPSCCWDGRCGGKGAQLQLPRRVHLRLGSPGGELMRRRRKLTKAELQAAGATSEGI